MRAICRPGRFWPVFAALALALLGLGRYWFTIHKSPAAVRQPPPKQAIIPATTVPPQIREIIGSFRPNQTITEALSQHGLSITLINQIVESARPVYNLAKVKASRLYWLCITQEGKFRNFRYPLDNKSYLTVYHDEAQDKLVSVVKDFQYKISVESVSADID